VSFIQENRNLYTAKQMCAALKFPRSTCYKALVSVPSKREQECKKFAVEVKNCFWENKRIYGAIKLQRTIINKGIKCSIRRVQRYMRNQGLRSIVIKRYNRHANNGKIPNDKENILSRDFSTSTMNEKWVTDITYVHVLKEGWTYPHL